MPQDTETWTKIELSEAAINQMLNLSSKLPGDDTENRTLQLNVSKELRLEGRNKDDKEFTSAVIPDVKITGKHVIAALNREYLQTALRCGLDEIRIHTELEPLLFLKPGKRMVVMPVRLQGPVTEKAPETEPSSTNPATPQPTTSPQPNAEAKPERKADMPKASTKLETPKPAQSQLTLIDQVEQIKETLKNVIRDLSALVDAVKQAEKENRASEKEVEAARAMLKKLQQVSL